MNNKKPKERWVVNYTPKNYIDEWSIGSCLKIFDNKKEALEYVEKNRIKDKPDYWQPNLRKQIEKTEIVKTWVNA